MKDDPHATSAGSVRPPDERQPRTALAMSRAPSETADNGSNVPEGFLARPVVSLASIAAASPTLVGDAAVGVPVIPGFTQLRRIGRGSHADVWHAVESSPPGRQVAIKVLASSASIDRFDLERDVIGRMAHDGIARVFGGGTTSTGQPYLVMEYVDGQPLTVACDRWLLDRRQRVALIVDACRAVQHAHERGVLHRDLKPSNLLVTRAEGRFIAKVIDFGVAKALESSLAAPLSVTVAGQIVGTPAYMSPEQRSGSLASIDVRTDVYGLGSVLFEVLAGTQRWDLAGRSLMQALDVVAHAPPRRLADVACDVPPDLAAIVEKAVSVQPDDRYPSVAALGADLERWLRGEPVVARSASLARRARWWSRQHPVAALGIAGVLAGLLLVTGFALSLYQVERNRHAELRRWVRTSIATLNGISDVSGSLETRDALSAFIIEQAVPTLRGDPASRTLLAEAYRERGDVLRVKGDIAGSLAMREQSLALAADEARDAPTDIEAQRRLAHATVLVGDAHREGGLIAEARDCYRAAHALYLTLDASAHADTSDRSRLAWSFDRLADIRLADANGADPALDPTDRAAAADEARACARTMLKLAETLPVAHADPRERTRALHARVAALARTLVTAGDAHSVDALTSLHRRCIDEAELLVATAPKERAFATLYAVCLGRGALFATDVGETALADEWLRRGLALADARLAADPDDLDWRYHLTESHATLAACHLRGRRFDEAADALARGRSLGEPLLLLQPRHPAYLGVHARLASLQAALDEQRLAHHE